MPRLTRSLGYTRVFLSLPQFWEAYLALVVLLFLLSPPSFEATGIRVILLYGVVGYLRFHLYPTISERQPLTGVRVLLQVLQWILGVFLGFLGVHYGFTSWMEAGMAAAVVGMTVVGEVPGWLGVEIEL